jgi:hypothetical protein
VKSFILLSSLLVVSTASLASTKHIHNWKAGKNQNWHSAVIMSNVCHDDSVEATVKLWSSSGSELANKSLSSGIVTDGNGEVTYNLAPHESVHIQISGANFSTYTFGSGSVTSSYQQSGVECLVAGYHSYYSVNGTSHSFIMNDGNPF